MLARSTWAAVLVLYLDPGFLANLANRALHFLQIVRQFAETGRPTPAASKTFVFRSLIGRSLRSRRLHHSQKSHCTCFVTANQKTGATSAAVSGRRLTDHGRLN
jgi:hypothetical protein